MNDSQLTKISRRQFSKALVAGAGLLASWEMNIFGSVVSPLPIQASTLAISGEISGTVNFPNPNHTKLFKFRNHALSKQKKVIR